ncbi:unnamed protein product [Protopolystoma xenopodis]|uniref:Uncharacterized protein n=1 Tax=Protopolystoma xenopodis TaxID=117903 RepID=A0A3S5BSA2_9PLAT|nr:unnamed protein product [Protopolystoma xenopodis]
MITLAYPQFIILKVTAEQNGQVFGDEEEAVDIDSNIRKDEESDYDNDEDDEENEDSDDNDGQAKPEQDAAKEHKRSLSIAIPTKPRTGSAS